MADETGLLKLDLVTKVFVTDEVETHALAGIHMDIKKGEYVSISGPSGCGKSTLLAILRLLGPPTDRQEKVGMPHRVKHYPSQLSGGQQQRVAVARALVGSPSVLLADEPTGNLDSANGEAVMDLMRELHQNGATICMVTHDPRYARFADRTIRLFDGRIVEESVEATST